jgi:hypothetical protein
MKSSTKYKARDKYGPIETENERVGTVDAETPKPRLTIMEPLRCARNAPGAERSRVMHRSTGWTAGRAADRSRAARARKSTSSSLPALAAALLLWAACLLAALLLCRPPRWSARLRRLP